MATKFDIKTLVPDEYQGFKIYIQKRSAKYHRDDYYVAIVKSGKIVHQQFADSNFGIYKDNPTKEDVLQAAKRFIDESLMNVDTDVKVGDVFENSWGYDQTQYDFLIVTSVSPTGKTVKARMLKQHRSEEIGFMTYDVSPTKEAHGPEFQLKVDYYRGRLQLVGQYPYSIGRESGEAKGWHRGSFEKVEPGKKYRMSNYG